MKVLVIESFAARLEGQSKPVVPNAGDLLDLPDDVAAAWIVAGLVVPLGEPPLTAVTEAKKKGRKA